MQMWTTHELINRFVLAGFVDGTWLGLDDKELIRRALVCRTQKMLRALGISIQYLEVKYGHK